MELPAVPVTAAVQLTEIAPMSSVVPSMRTIGVFRTAAVHVCAEAVVVPINPSVTTTASAKRNFFMWFIDNLLRKFVEQVFKPVACSGVRTGLEAGTHLVKVEAPPLCVRLFC
jgi:hypothetical protein